MAWDSSLQPKIFNGEMKSYGFVLKRVVRCEATHPNLHKCYAFARYENFCKFSRKDESHAVIAKQCRSNLNAKILPLRFYCEIVESFLLVRMKKLKGFSYDTRIVAVGVLDVIWAGL